jgi:hypothetical protein
VRFDDAWPSSLRLTIRYVGRYQLAKLAEGDSLAKHPTAADVSRQRRDEPLYVIRCDTFLAIV